MCVENVLAAGFLSAPRATGDGLIAAEGVTRGWGELPGMREHEVTRTLVKSQPEIWAQCSVAESLERHMSGSFGEIRITRLEPEHSVAWEGEQVRGTVKIEPSAWGTRVTMAVQMEAEVAPPPPLTPAASGEASEPVQTSPAPPPAAEEPGRPAQNRFRQGRRLSRRPLGPWVASDGGLADSAVRSTPRTRLRCRLSRSRTN